jgi:hypothetical protein
MRGSYGLPMIEHGTGGQRRIGPAIIHRSKYIAYRALGPYVEVVLYTYIELYLAAKLLP